MQAVLTRQTGDPEVLELEEVDRPEPGDGELLVAVRAASINPVDWKQRRGTSSTELPAVLGRDVSGVVEVSRADGFAEGDEVFGNGPGGGYAEFATLPADVVAKKPEGLSHEQAAALPVAGLTAWQALFDVGGLEAGQTVVVVGAAGGSGISPCNSRRSWPAHVSSARARGATASSCSDSEPTSTSTTRSNTWPRPRTKPTSSSTPSGRPPKRLCPRSAKAGSSSRSRALHRRTRPALAAPAPSCS